MARGDVVADVVNVSSSSSSTVQPGSGVEWIIRAFSGDNSTSSHLRSADGTSVGAICNGGEAADIGGKVTVPINNTNYVEMRNGSGSNLILSYYGYITKD
jgi:hypothetical protein